MTADAQAPALVARQASDLIERPAEILAEAEDNPLLLTRPDGDALVLMSQREAESREQLYRIAVPIITAVLDGDGSLAERLSKTFPWMLALSEADRASCAQELVDAVRAAVATEEPHVATAALTSWKETATAVAAGLNGTELEWLDD